MSFDAENLKSFLRGNLNLLLIHGFLILAIPLILLIFGTGSGIQLLVGCVGGYAVLSIVLNGVLGRTNLLAPKQKAFLAEHQPSIHFYAIPLLLILLIPTVFGYSTDVANLVLYIEIYMILALGLNVVVGYTGLLDLGFVSFMAVGAVLTAQCLVLTIHPETGALFSPVGTTETVLGKHPLIFPFSFFLIMLFSGLVCALIGILRGIPTLRLSGDYYAIVTLGIAEIIFLILFNEESLSGGAFGIKLTKHSRPELFGE
ncbi:MAG: ABC transporter permease subunit, partial [Planctomycetota bacterium]